MTSTTLSMTAKHHDELKSHLYPGDGKEAVSIALCGARRGDRRHRLVVQKLIHIQHSACEERTPVNVKWDTDLIVAALEEAEHKQLSVLKIHSHPTGYKSFSSTDDASDLTLLPAVRGWVEANLPHGSAVMLPDGELFGRYWTNAVGFADIDRVMIVGDDLRIWQKSLPVATLEQRSFGASHAQLFGERTIEEFGGLSIAVVGCSGTGSLVIEQLARLGIGELVLVDDDSMSHRNVNRITNSRMSDAAQRRFKVDVLAERIQEFNLGTRVIPVAKNLWHPDAVREVAQSDIVFGCMDSVDGRFILNRLATYYVLPYLDLGVRLVAQPDGPNAGAIQEVCGTVHYLQPGKSSLISRGLIDIAAVAASGLKQNDPTAHARQLEDNYISGVAEQRPAVITVNMFIASLAVHELLCRLHPYREEPNAAYASLEFSLSSMEFFPERDADQCRVLRSGVGLGDITPLLGLPQLG